MYVKGRVKQEPGNWINVGKYHFLSRWKLVYLVRCVLQ